MGTTNLRLGLELKLAHHKGELVEVRKQIGDIQEGVARLSDLHDKLRELEDVIASVEKVIKFDHPNWQTEKIKPVKRGRWTSPIPNGEQGRRALDVLRQTDDLSCSEISKEILRRINHDPEDKLTRERIANTLLAYMKKHEGDLVECTGRSPKKWRVIR